MLYFITYMIQVIPTIRDTTQALACLSFSFILMLSLGYLMNYNDPCTPKIMKFNYYGFTVG